jgi:bacteriorhodopsin
MYAFKVFVTTLIILLLVILTYTATRSDAKGRYVAYGIIIVNILSVLAIWG